MTKSDGGPAFAGPCQSETAVDIHEGLSLRDYFAAAALQGMVGKAGIVYDGQGKLMYAEQARKLVKTAYMVSDAMLKAREQ
jgi:hypothetical protein